MLLSLMLMMIIMLDSLLTVEFGAANFFSLAMLLLHIAMRIAGCNMEILRIRSNERALHEPAQICAQNLDARTIERNEPVSKTQQNQKIRSLSCLHSRSAKNDDI